MQQSTLFNKFSSAISWNAFLYIAHRLFSTSFIFFLYRASAPQLFSLWSTTLSIIFIILLWLDFGFRKSIARYAPLFAQHSAFALFSKTVLSFQLTVLIIASPIFYYFFPSLSIWIMKSPSLILPPRFILIATSIFIIEGLVEILRLLYHSHFLNKPFNLLVTITRLFESIVSIFLVVSSPSTPLPTLFTIKLLSGLIIVTVSTALLPYLYRTAQHDFPSSTTSPTQQLHTLWLRFIKHSLMMWISNVIKSLSERNFIVPLLTHTLGLSQANIFKLAQDGALLFERSIIKTVGTADTALLAHAETERKENGTRDNAFKKLTHQVAGLCFPLFGILFFLFLEGMFFDKKSDVFQIFLLLTGSYLLEALLSPYERILEVRQRYWLLSAAYLPYLIGLFFILTGNTSIGLVSFVIFLQGVRLVSSSIMIGLSYYYYHLGFPIVFTLRWLSISLLSSLLAWVGFHYFFNFSLLGIFL